MRIMFMIAISLCVFGSAFAAGNKLSDILDQQRALATQLDEGGTSGLTIRQKNLIRKAQKEVFAITDGKTSLDQLSMDDKVRLENALERINAEVKGGGLAATNEQNVCWRERKTGSTVKVTRCGTEAERREAREGARDFLDRPRVCAQNCGSQL